MTLWVNEPRVLQWGANYDFWLRMIFKDTLTSLPAEQFLIQIP